MRRKLVEGKNRYTIWLNSLASAKFERMKNSANGKTYSGIIQNLILSHNQDKIKEVQDEIDATTKEYNLKMEFLGLKRKRILDEQKKEIKNILGAKPIPVDEYYMG